MRTLGEFINCSQFIQFYDKYESTTVNLVDVLSDEEVSTTYHEGLKELTLYLNTADSAIEEEMKEILGIEYFDLQDHLDDVFIMLYKVTNAHYILNDLSSTEISYYMICDRPINATISNSVEMTFKGQRIYRFFKYAVFFKIFVASFQIVRSGGLLSSKNIKQSTTAISRQNEAVKEYQGHNKFLKDFGFFIPHYSTLDNHFFQLNTSLFDIIPSMVYHLKGDPNLINEQPIHENGLEGELKLHLESAKLLFLTHGVKFEFKTQLPKSLKLDDDSETSASTSVRLDIGIVVNGTYTIPVELKFNNIKLIFNNFMMGRDKRNRLSKTFIEIFSQAYHQSLLCYSRIFFLTDAFYCICVIIDIDPLDMKDDISNLTGVPCTMIPFDSEVSGWGVSLFIIMAILVHYDKLLVDKNLFDRFRESIQLTEAQKDGIAEKQYNTLNQFAQLCSEIKSVSVPIVAQDMLTSAGSNFDTLTSKSTTTASLMDIDEEAACEFRSEIELGNRDEEEEISLESFTRFESDNEGDDNEYGDIDKSNNDNELNNTEVELDILDDIQIDYQYASVIEAEIKKRWNVQVSLTHLAQIVYAHKFEMINIRDIKAKSILSGNVIHINYSTVIESNEVTESGERVVYKVYDPIRARILTGDNTVECLSLPETIIKVFKLFIRECITHIYLEGKNFKNKPKLLGIGFVQNSCCKSSEVLDIAQEYPLSGFVLKLEMINGYKIDKRHWNKNIENSLRTVSDQMHTLGVSHGDLHVGNIMFDPKRNSVVVYDYGESYLSHYRGLRGRQKKAMKSEFAQRCQWDNENLNSLIRELNRHRVNMNLNQFSKHK